VKAPDHGGSNQQFKITITFEAGFIVWLISSGTLWLRTEPIRDAHKCVNFQGQNFVAKKKSR